MAKSKIDLAPSKGLRHFVFTACTVEQSGKTITVAVQGKGLTWRGARVDKKGHASWTQPLPLEAKTITIACKGRAPSRSDGAEYPNAAHVEGPTILFTGGASFARVLHGATSKFVVHATVESIKGLPRGTSWNNFESIEIDGAKVSPIHAAEPKATKGGPELADGGSGSGPHQPYP